MLRFDILLMLPLGTLVEMGYFGSHRPSFHRSSIDVWCVLVPMRDSLPSIGVLDSSFIFFWFLVHRGHYWTDVATTTTIASRRGGRVLLVLRNKTTWKRSAQFQVLLNDDNCIDEDCDDEQYLPPADCTLHATYDIRCFCFCSS